MYSQNYFSTLESPEDWGTVIFTPAVLAVTISQFFKIS